MRAAAAAFAFALATALVPVGAGAVAPPLPFDVPFATVAEGLDEGRSWRVVDAQVDACVAFAREMAAEGAEVAPNVVIAGVGFEPTLERWTIVAARDGLLLLVVHVSDDNGRCRLEASDLARPVRDGAYRRLQAPLFPFDASPVLLGSGG